MSANDQNRLPEAQGEVRRRRRRKRRSKRESGWWHPFAMRGLLAVLALFTLLSFINPLRWIIERTGEPNLLQDVVFNGGMQLLGLTFLAATIILGAHMARKATLRNNSTWARTGCPKCGNIELKRTERLNWHLQLERMTKIPYRRYLCKECRWQGLRIDQSRITT